MADSCDQLDTCGLPCPADWEPNADLVGVYGVSAAAKALHVKRDLVSIVSLFRPSVIHPYYLE